MSHTSLRFFVLFFVLACVCAYVASEDLVYELCRLIYCSLNCIQSMMMGPALSQLISISLFLEGEGGWELA